MHKLYVRDITQKKIPTSVALFFCSVKEDEIQTLREENETLRRDLQRRIQASDGELALQKQVPQTQSNLLDDKVGFTVTSVFESFAHQTKLLI